MPFIKDFFMVLSGLCLFLYGVEETSRICRDVLSGSASVRLAKLTASRWGACLFGVLLSAFSQSSVVATSFALGLVDAGLLPYSGAIIVMMGASAGGMLAMFFISLNVTQWAPIMLTITTFSAKFSSGKMKKTSLLLRAVSLIFFGMYVLGFGARPILDEPIVSHLITQSATQPLVLALISLVTTLVLQSSSAVMALAFTLLASSSLTFTECVPIILGTHLGSSIPVFLASLSGKPNAKRLGLLVLIYKAVGVPLLLPVIPMIVHFTERLPVSDGVQLTVVANAVAMGNTLLLLPFAGMMTRVSQGWFQQQDEGLAVPQHLDLSIVDYPELALPLLFQELENFSKYLENLMELLLTGNGSDPKVKVLNRALPDLGKACMGYLRAIPMKGAEHELSSRYEGMLRSLLGMRNFSRSLRKELLPVVKIRQATTPPLAEREEWDGLVSLLCKISERVFCAFREQEGFSRLTADKLLAMEGKYAKMERAFEEELLLKRLANTSSKDLETLVALSNLLKALVEIYNGCEIYYGLAGYSVTDEASEAESLEAEVAIRSA